MPCVHSRLLAARKWICSLLWGYREQDWHSQSRSVPDPGQEPGTTFLLQHGELAGKASSSSSTATMGITPLKSLDLITSLPEKPHQLCSNRALLVRFKSQFTNSSALNQRQQRSLSLSYPQTIAHSQLPALGKAIPAPAAASPSAAGCTVLPEAGRGQIWSS